MMITLIILNLNICIFITENLRQCNAMQWKVKNRRTLDINYKYLL